MRSFRTAVLFVLACVPLLAAGCNISSDFWPLNMLFPPPGETLVVMAFDPNDPDRRREGINKLSEQSWGLRDPHLKGYALLLRADEDPSVRSAAARALGKAGDARYLPDLVRALERTAQPAEVRWDVAVALDHVIGDEAVAPLRRHATDDPAVDVRISCVRALRHYRAPEVVRALVACLSDPAFSVRHEAHAVLVALTGEDPGYEPEDWAPLTQVELKPPAPTWRRPWWDWFGVRRSRRGRGEQSATSGSSERRRPWWDWFGVRGSRPKPADTPASAPAARRRPWWDWFKVTGSRGADTSESADPEAPKD